MAKIGVDIKIDFGELDRASKQAGQAVQKTFAKASRRFIRLSRSYAPYLTGNLRASIQVIERGKTELKLGSKGVVYAAIHEFGGRAGRNRSVYIREKRYLRKAGDIVAKEMPNLAKQAMKELGL